MKPKSVLVHPTQHLFILVQVSNHCKSFAVIQLLASCVSPGQYYCTWHGHGKYPLSIFQIICGISAFSLICPGNTLHSMEYACNLGMSPPGESEFSWLEPADSDKNIKNQQLAVSRYWTLLMWVLCLHLNQKAYTVPYLFRRKFRNQTSDLWTGAATVARAVRERVSRKKINERKKVDNLRNTVFLPGFVAPTGRKVGSLKSGRCGAIWLDEW